MPLVPPYNNLAKPASRRIEKHRQQVQALFFTERFRLVMRQDRIVIPQTDLGNDEGNLRQWVVDLAHELIPGW